MAEEQRNHISLPHPDSLKRPSTAGEVEKMLSLCRKMVSVSLEWAEEEKCLSHADAGVLKAICSTILTKVKVKWRMKVVHKKELNVKGKGWWRREGHKVIFSKGEDTFPEEQGIFLG